ncbi:hypothetical protein TH0950_14050 [Helicobacter pylori]
MLIPFLKISAHYSTSDRVGLKRLEKNSKIKKRKQWGLAKRKRLIPQKNKEFKNKELKTKGSKKESSKKESLKKEKERVQKKPPKKGVPQRVKHQ